MFKYSKSATQFTIYSKSWYDYLKQFGKCRDKFIPQIIKDSSVPLLKSLIKTLMLGDGSDGV